MTTSFQMVITPTLIIFPSLVLVFFRVKVWNKIFKIFRVQEMQWQLDFGGNWGFASGSIGFWKRELQYLPSFRWFIIVIIIIVVVVIMVMMIFTITRTSGDVGIFRHLVKKQPLINEICWNWVQLTQPPTNQLGLRRRRLSLANRKWFGPIRDFLSWFTCYGQASPFPFPFALDQWEKIAALAQAARRGCVSCTQAVDNLLCLWSFFSINYIFCLFRVLCELSWVALVLL